MVHLVGRHFVDKEHLDRLESAIMLGLIGVGLAVCVIVAAIYDIGHWFSGW